MRIIAGTAKGRRLASPPGLETRPLTGRAKEALFSSLGGAVAGATVLDAYAGSGSLGLEALSRGAAQVTFVERSKQALTALRANIESVGLGGIVEPSTVEHFLAGSVGSHFDLVFLDPPYALDTAAVSHVLSLLVPWLAAHATVVLHRRVGAAPPEPPEVLRLVDRRRYGDVELLRFVKEEP